MIHLGKKFDPSVDRTINIISKLYSEFGEREIHLFSDSIDQAKINFKNHEFFGRILKLKCYELSTIESIRKCVYADFFIGTESKISLWIVNLRNFKGKEKKTHFEYFKDLLYTS
jgi:hypothetical protein